MEYIWNKENEINKENVEIGDEVINQHGTKSIVVGFTNNGIILCFANMETKRPSFYVYEDEKKCQYSLCIKTGEHYDYIKEMFEEVI